jgi:hypothetical protein
LKLPEPETGSQPSSIEKKMINSGPNKKLGIASAMELVNVMAASIPVFSFNAAAVPNGKEIITANNIEHIARKTVLGRTDKILLITL